MHYMAEIIPYIISKIPFSLAFPDSGSMALSPQQPNPLCVVRRLGRGKKESARGTMGRGKKGRRAPAFSLFPSPTARLLFFNCCYFFYWKTQLVAKTDRKRAAKFF